MPIRTRFLILLAAIAVGLGAAASAVAQDDAPQNEPAAQADGGDTFAKQFFISTRTDINGERSVELLGSVIIWFLLTLSALSIGLIGMMAATNQRKSIVPPGVIDEIRVLVGGGKFREALELTRAEPSYFSQIVHAALREANHGFAAMLRNLEQTADELTTRRLRQIEYLNVLGQVSPMIGLFGTVYGMIVAFQAIVASGGDADPVQLAGGIGTALTTTFWGLIVAIPALAGYAIIRNKIDELTTEATIEAEELLNQFRPQRSRSSQSSRPGEG